MCTYQGGKQKLGKQIHDVIQSISEELNMEDVPYFEPFVGMAGVLIHFAKDNKREIYACDYNPNIILMWQELQNGWIPHTKYSKEEYLKLKEQKYPSPSKGFVGSVCSFGGIFFGGYRAKCGIYDSIKRGSEKLVENSKIMKNVEFVNPSSYDEFSPEGMVIYCDPPYINNGYTIHNKYFNFDHKHFWDVMRLWSKKNLVFISEYTAPKDFICVWKKTYLAGTNGTKGSHKITNEKLFILKKSITTIL